MHFSLSSLLCVCVLALTHTHTQAHQWKLGRCKDITPVANFDPLRFNGTWYVHFKTATSSSCLTTTFDLDEETMTYRVTERRIPLASTLTPLDLQMSNVGEVRVGAEKPARMNLKWEGFALNLLPYELTIADTDYDTYAIAFECQSLLRVSKRVSASILTRSPDTLTQEQEDTYKAILSTLPDVDMGKMSAVTHGNCEATTDNDFNVQLDNNGISLLGLAGNEEVRKIMTEEEAEAYVEKVRKEEEGRE